MEASPDRSAPGRPTPDFEPRDISDWTRFLGNPPQELVRAVLIEMTGDQVAVDDVMPKIDTGLRELFWDNGFFIGEKDGYKAAIFFNSSDISAVLAVQTPEHQIGLFHLPRAKAKRFHRMRPSGHPWVPTEAFDPWWWMPDLKRWLEKDLKDPIIKAENATAFIEPGPHVTPINLPKFNELAVRTPIKQIAPGLVALLKEAFPAFFDGTYKIDRRDYGEGFSHEDIISSRFYQALRLGSFLNEVKFDGVESGLLRAEGSWPPGHFLRNSPWTWRLAPGGDMEAFRYVAAAAPEVLALRQQFFEQQPFWGELIAKSRYYRRHVSSKNRLPPNLFEDFRTRWLADIDAGHLSLARMASYLTEQFRQVKGQEKVTITPRHLRHINALETLIDEGRIHQKEQTNQLIATLASLPRASRVAENTLPRTHSGYLRFFEILDESIDPLLKAVGQSFESFSADLGEALSAYVLRDGDDLLSSYKKFYMARIGNEPDFDYGAHCFNFPSPDSLGDYTDSTAGPIILAYAVRRALEQGKGLTDDFIDSCRKLEAKGLLFKAMQARPLRVLIDASDAWHETRTHDDFMKAKNLFGSISIDISEWAALSEPVQAPNGYTLTPLTDKEALAEEGKIMDHCVAGYYGNCLWDRTHILSVRDEKGNRVSTLELRDRFPDSYKPSSIDHLIDEKQHNAVHNRSAPPEARDAVEWYLKSLKSGEIPVKLDEIQTTRQKLASGKVAGLLGYDPTEDDKAQTLFEYVCRRYLPGTLKERKTVEKAIAAMGLTDLIEEEVAKLPADKTRPAPTVRALPRSGLEGGPG